jgi:hypothetical protein
MAESTETEATEEWEPGAGVSPEVRRAVEKALAVRGVGRLAGEGGAAVDEAALKLAGDQGVGAARTAKPDTFEGKKSGLAPSNLFGKGKKVEFEEAIQQAGLTLDDLTFEQRAYYDNFEDSAFSRKLRPEGRYAVARLKAEGAIDPATRKLAEKIQDEALNEIAKYSLPERMRDMAQGAASKATEGAKRAVANPGQALKTAGRGALAAGSLLPDPTDLVALAASAPYLGAHELGARGDFAAQLDQIAPEHSAGERPVFEADQLSGRQKADIREFVLNSPHPMSAARLLVHDRKYITPEALDEIIK